MTNDDLLVMLKSDLEIITDYMDEEARAAKDAELSVYLTSAQAYIEREGATLSLQDVGDCQLIVMYAAWLYSKRRAESGADAMPRMLRFNLNNKLFGAQSNGNG